MSQHPLNLAVRFLLEMAALVAIGYWGFDQHSGAWRWILGLGLPLLAATAWGTFAVRSLPLSTFPGDRSRSGGAPVPVPGAVRLLLELALFGLAMLALPRGDAGRPILALILAGVTVIHYAVSYDRIAWLLRQKGGRQTQAPE